MVEWEARRLELSADAAQHIRTMLPQLALLTYLKADRTVRPRKRKIVAVSEARQLFSSAPEKQSLLHRLFDSSFLAITPFRLQEGFGFHSELHRDYYAALGLLSLKREGEKIAAQTMGREDWAELLSFYIQLQQGEESNEKF